MRNIRLYVIKIRDTLISLGHTLILIGRKCLICICVKLKEL